MRGRLRYVLAILLGRARLALKLRADGLAEHLGTCLGVGLRAGLVERGGG